LENSGGSVESAATAVFAPSYEKVVTANRNYRYLPTVISKIEWVVRFDKVQKKRKAMGFTFTFEKSAPSSSEERDHYPRTA
jgi:hypothetical protein